MSDQDSVFRDRGRALEETFFAVRNRELLNRMRSELASQALSCATGITDPQLLQRLVDAGVTPEAAAALALIPLVMVAWADGQVQPDERDALLRAADAHGVTKSCGGGLLSEWLHGAPDAALCECWRAYAKALQSRLKPGEFQDLAQDLVKRAEEVARAAGGYLGVASVSPGEKKVIGQLRADLGM